MTPDEPPALPIRRPLQQALAYCCLALSMALVGSYVALSKPLSAALPVFLLAWLRFGIGAIAMLHWLKRPADEAPLSKQTRRLLFLESFLGNFLFSICMIYGVSLTSAVSAGIIMSTIPAVVALMSWAFLRERIGIRLWAAVACAIVGIGLLSLQGAGKTTAGLAEIHIGTAYQQAWLGNFLLVCAVVCEAAYAVIGKKLTRVLSPKRISALINLWGLVLVTPPGLWLAIHFEFASVTPTTWLLLLFYALAASVWTVWLWMTGLKSVPAAQAGVFTVMLPVSAALVGVFLLGEELGLQGVIALSVALLGVLLATVPGKAS
jgi:drug/metabolite transporter (DMT)-like permease